MAGRVKPLGHMEIAELLGVKRGHVYVLKTQGKLPPPDMTVSGHDLWWPETVDAWRVQTGRKS